MTDIFDTKIVCKNCNIQMKPKILEREGLQLRAVECPKCGDKIVHPADLVCLNKFNDVKDKTFNVKLRMVGNSHTISIPKEIVDLMNEQQRIMRERHKTMNRDFDDIVRLAFEDFGRLSLNFFDEDVDDVADGEKGGVRRKVKNYGNGNIDVIEEKDLSDEESGVRGVRFRKFSRRRLS